MAGLFRDKGVLYLEHTLLKTFFIFSHEAFVQAPECWWDVEYHNLLHGHHDAQERQKGDISAQYVQFNIVLSLEC